MKISANIDFVALRRKLLSISRSAVFLMLLCNWGCGGPARPKYYAEQCLSAQHINQDLIQQLIMWQDVGRDNFETFSQHPDENVRYMVAANPYTPPDILDRLAHDKSDIVFQGIASNRNLPEKTLNEQLKNKSRLQYLVSNRQLSPQMLLKIYYEHRDIPLSCFAMNPNCPEEIREIIRKSGDYAAKACLEALEKRDSAQKSR